MTIDTDLNRKLPFGIDLNKVLPDLLRLQRQNKGTEAWHTIFTIYISKRSNSTGWQ